MGGPKEAQSFVDTWIPRLWGLAVGVVLPIGMAALVTVVFPADAARDSGSEIEFVYPNDL